MSVTRTRGRIMNRPRLALIGSTAVATLVWLIPQSQCAAETADGDDEEISKEVDAVEKVILNTVGPLVTKMGYGGVMGFFSGLAMKKVGQIAAFFVGIGFVAIQVLQPRANSGGLSVKEGIEMLMLTVMANLPRILSSIGANSRASARRASRVPAASPGFLIRLLRLIARERERASKAFVIFEQSKTEKRHLWRPFYLISLISL